MQGMIARAPSPTRRAGSRRRPRDQPPAHPRHRRPSPTGALSRGRRDRAVELPARAVDDRHASPALIAGCAVVLKPSEVTPRYVEPLRRIFAAVPAARCRVPRRARPRQHRRRPRRPCRRDRLHRQRAHRAASSPSTRRAASFPAFLELGGKDPVIVTRRADLERAATVVLRGSILARARPASRSSASTSIAAVYAPFMQRLLEKARARAPHRRRPDGQIGPFIMARQAEIVREHVADAVARGAKLEHGGRIVERGGVWCEPTVLRGVTHDDEGDDRGDLRPGDPGHALSPRSTKAVALANAATMACRPT